MTDNPRRLVAWILLLAGALVYGHHTVGKDWQRVKGVRHGRDFASYYYAGRAAQEGRDPYNKRVLSRLAHQDETRPRGRGVHPFFYPPPFLLAVSWTLPLDLQTSYRAWFWLDSLFLLAVMLALWKWLPSTGMLLGGGLVLASFTPIPDTHWMGQANLLVLAALCWGLVLVERESAGPRGEWWGGALVGLACMLKMSPALLVAWWVVRKRWRPVIGACAAGVVLSLLTLPLLGVSGQWHFYSQVLPTFSSGDYQGLTVPITIYGNHSIANLFVQASHHFWPETAAIDGIPDQVRPLSTAVNLLLVGGSLWWLRRPAKDAVSLACSAGALVVWMLLVPPYTYEHHMVYLLLPIAALVAALGERRLRWQWGIGLVPAYAFLAWQLQDMKGVGRGMDAAGAWWLQESKFLAAIFLGVACLVAARPRVRSTESVA